MEQAILAMLGITITLMLYLDRGRRADIAQLRMELHDGLKEVRAEAHADNTQLRSEMNEGFKWVHQRLDKLTDVVMDLCRRVGGLEVRSEGPDSKPDPSQ